MKLGNLFGLKRTKPSLVRVKFRDLNAPVPEMGDAGWYVYEWHLSDTPQVGTRVFVPGGDGRAAAAVVVGIGTAADGRGHDLKQVVRIATDADIEAAHAKAAADLDAWLRMARKAAGLPGAGRVRSAPPEGYPVIPPASGDASPRDADKHGRVWYRAWKRAEEAGRPDDEVRAFRDIAYRWYAIRDRG